MDVRGFIRYILKREPENAAEWVDRGDYLVSKDQLEDAVGLYGHALALDPDNLRALRGKAGAVRRMGDIEGAKKIYLRILSLDPDDSKTLLALGFVHSVDGNSEKALECFNQVLQKDPGNDTANALRFLVLHEGHTEGERLELVREIEAANPGFFSRMTNEVIKEAIRKEILGFPQGERIRITGDTPYQTRDMRTLEESLPGIIQGARLMLRDFSPDGAVDLTDLDAAKSPPDPDAMFRADAGELEKLRKSQPVTAQEWFDKGDQLCRNADHGLNLENEIRQELYQEAGLCFDRVITLRPERELIVRGMLGKGYTAMKLAHFPEALSCFEEAVGLAPEDPAGLKGKAHALSNLGHAKEAARCFEKLQAIEDTSDPHHALWMTERTRGYIVSKLVS